MLNLYLGHTIVGVSGPHLIWDGTRHPVQIKHFAPPPDKILVITVFTFLPPLDNILVISHVHVFNLEYYMYIKFQITLQFTKVILY